MLEFAAIAYFVVRGLGFLGIDVSNIFSFLT